MLGGAVVDERGRLIGAEVLAAQVAGDGEVGVGGNVAEEGEVAVEEGAEDEGFGEVVQGGGGVGPGVDEMPDLRDGGELGRGPEAGKVVGGEEGSEGVVVVLVDGFELRVFRGGVGGGEGYVGVAPFLREVGPGDCGCEESDGRGNGGRRGVEGEGGLGGEGVGYGGAPVDKSAEDLLMFVRFGFQREGIRSVCCDCGGSW